MNYYYDTEFCEYKKKPMIGKSINTIDLISIGVVSEDDRTYYAICKDFDLKAAWNSYQWETNEHTVGFSNNIEKVKEKVYRLRDNVLYTIWKELKSKEYGGSIERQFSYRNIKWLINEYGKTKNEIANDVYNFVNTDLGFDVSGYSNSEFRDKNSYLSKHFDSHDVMLDEKENKFVAQPTFFGYYSAYDHVCLSWLFGRMIDLPTGFPMYTKDLKQTLDEKVTYLISKQNNKIVKGTHYPNFEEALVAFKSRKDYPTQENEHNALDDALWNKKLHNFLNNL